MNDSRLCITATRWVLFGLMATVFTAATARAAVSQVTSPANLAGCSMKVENFEDSLFEAGVSWSAPAGTRLASSCGFASECYQYGPYQGLSTNQAQRAITFSFAQPTYSAGLWFGNDDRCCSSGFTAFLDLFNGNSLVATLSRVANMNDFADQFIGFNADQPITSMVLRYQTSGGPPSLYVYADNLYFSTASGPNTPPVAQPDSYSVNEDAVLSISAPGLLANDTDANGNTLQASLYSNPTHGSLSFSSNGSFTYTPAANYSGPDSFQYTARDCGATSNVTTVTISVSPQPDEPMLAWQTPTPIVYGTALGSGQLNAAATFNGQPVPGTYSYSPAAGAVLGVGSRVLSVTFTPSDTVAFQSVTKTVGLQVTSKSAKVRAENKGRLYGSANPALTAVVEGAVNGDTIQYSLATTASASSGVGDYAITVTLGANPNYDVEVANAILTIDRKPATVKADDKSRVYGSANPALTAAVDGTVNGDSLDYSLATAADSSTGVGDYPITVTLGSNPNYDITATDATLAITKKAASVAAEAKSRVYGSANPALTAIVEGTVNGDTLAYTLGTGAGATSGVGEYSITVTLGSNPNYEIATTNAILTIDRKPASVAAESKSKLYGSMNPALTAIVEGTVNGDTLDYTLGTGASPMSGVGNYAITVTLGSNPNYDITATDSLLTIHRKPASVAAESKSRMYGSDNPPLTAVVDGTVNGDSLQYTLVTAAVSTSAVGEYPISVTLGSNPNYDIATTDALLTIDRKPASVAAESKSKVYGSDNPPLTAVVNGTVNGDSLQYTLETSAGSSSAVGDYAITVTLGANPNYDIATTDAVLTVTRKSASVAAESKSKVYGSDNPPLTAVVDGTVNGDSLQYTLVTSAGSSSAVGDYAITVELGANPNYDIATTDAVLTITRKPASVSAENKSKVYGSDNPPLTAVVDGTVNGDSLQFTLVTSAGNSSAVGDYAITVALGANPNYDIATTDAVLTITRKPASVSAENKSKVYGSSNPALTAVVEGAVGNDTLAYSLSTTATAASSVGDYAITVTLGDNPNYDVGKTDAVLTVRRKPATVTADSKSKVYGSDNPPLTASVEGTVGDDVLVYSLSTPATATSGAGDHPITVTLGENPNYEVATTDAVLTISRKPATVTAENQSKAYGSENPELSATVEGTVDGGDAIDYALSTTAGNLSGVGDYAITVTLGTNPNYQVTATNATLVITKKPATVKAANLSKVYGSPNPELTAVVEGSVPGGDAIAYTLSTTAGNLSGVAEYAITVTLGDNPNYEVVATNATLSITKKPATVKAANRSKVYGSANPELTAVVEGAVEGGTPIIYSLETAATATSDVGAYAINVVLGTNPNYEVTGTNATLTITSRPITVTADAKSKVLNASDPALTYQVTSGNLVNGDSFSGAIVRDAGEAPGSYAIRQGTLALSSNYTLTFVNGTFSILFRAAGECGGGHDILQPINREGTSVFKRGSTVPAKFRVFDANCVSIGTPGVVTSFRLVQTIGGTTSSDVNEPVISTTPDAAFRWDPADQQWIFNINTKGLSANVTYVYAITLQDGTAINFRFGLK